MVIEFVLTRMEAFALEMNKELALIRPALLVMLTVLMLIDEVLIDMLVEI